jgi:hypothetical protein
MVAVMMFFTSAVFAQDKKGGNPYRDPKTGRFMTKADYEKKYGPLKKDAGKDTKSDKKTPARDPKTGKFVKKEDKKDEKKPATATTKVEKKDDKKPATATTKVEKKDDKKGPARDPKTGKFLKKDTKAPAKDSKKKDEKK